MLNTTSVIYIRVQLAVHVYTVLIGGKSSMVNKIALLNTIVYLGPPLCHCRGLLYKIGWQAVFTTALTILLIAISTGISQLKLGCQ